MTHAELVEKVQAAIRGGLGAGMCLSVPCLPGGYCYCLNSATRAAIATIAEALRVPSDKMTESGGKHIMARCPDMSHGSPYWTANAAWRAMLAASPLVQEEKQ